VKYVLGNASAFLEIDTLPQTKYAFGSVNGNNNLSLTRTAPNNDTIFNVNNLGGFGNWLTISNAFIHAQNASGFAAFTSVFVNGANLTGSSNAGVGGTPSGNVYLLAVNNSGVASSFAQSTIRVFGAGNGLYGKEGALYNAWVNYKNNTTFLDFPLDIIVGTNGVEKGYATTLFGELMSYPIVNGLQLVAAYTQPDDTVHIGFESATQLDGVDRITLEADNGEQLTLDWNGSEYVGMSAPFAAKFIVTTELTWKMIV
jgi:hypothetical protein